MKMRLSLVDTQLAKQLVSYIHGIQGTDRSCAVA
jgi:hypothetical protein